MVQEVLIFGEENWVLLAEITNTMEGVHVRKLRQVTGKTPRRQWNGIWRISTADIVLK